MDPGLEFKVALEEADKLNARYVAHLSLFAFAGELHCYYTSPALLSPQHRHSRINETGAHIRANLLELGVFRYCQA